MIEFRALLTALDVQVPADLDVHVIMDNYGTHKTALIRRWFARHPRFHPHWTYASWLNLVERWFAALETSNCVEACMTASARSPRFANSSTHGGPAICVDENRRRHSG